MNTTKSLRASRIADRPHPQPLSRARERGATSDALKLTELKALEQAAECLKVLAHPHRLRMVQMLLQGSFTVGELAEACGIASPMASDHLRLMQHCGFLTSRKAGRTVYYSVIEPHLERILACIEDRFDMCNTKGSK